MCISAVATTVITHMKAMMWDDYGYFVYQYSDDDHIYDSNDLDDDDDAGYGGDDGDDREGGD